MVDSPKKAEIGGLANGITIPFRSTRSEMVFRLVPASGTEVVLPSADEETRQDRVWARFTALIQINSWSFHDVMPIIMLGAWLTGVIASTVLSEIIPGGWPISFAAGFSPVWLLFVLLWPEKRS